MDFIIEEVNNRRLIRDFLAFPHQIYQEYSQWVSPLNLEIENIFSPKKNVFFQNGSANRWIIRSKENQILGRIAAFINEKKALQGTIKAGGVGFFECIDNQEAANRLFDTAKAWLEERGIDAMDGPINFGENDRYWGLMVEGFEQPAFGMPFHMPYYKDLFENYGFRSFFNQVSRELNITEPMPERFRKIGKWIQSEEDVKFINADHKNVEFFAKAFQEIYNEAWEFHENFTPMSDTQVKSLIADFKPLMISSFMPMALVKNEPAAFIVCIPDLNQIFKPFKGKLSLEDKLLFLWRKRNEFSWYLKNGILDRGRVVIMGVKPKFQKFGLESGLIMSSIGQARKLGFKRLELSWVGDFNPKMQSLLTATGAKKSAVHSTYRFVFNPEAKFERSAMIPMERKSKAQ